MTQQDNLDSVYVAGEKLYYNPQDRHYRDGLRYLERDLQRDETRVFFVAAREMGEAQFEDDDEHQFTIVYRQGVYTLEER